MAESFFEHAGEARAALQLIVSDPAHGIDALSQPQTMANLLGDVLPDAPREAGLLVAAASSGLPAMLREHAAQGMDIRTAISLSAVSLAGRTAFSPEACEWVSAELAIALGLAGTSQIPGPELSAVATLRPGIAVPRQGPEPTETVQNQPPRPAEMPTQPAAPSQGGRTKARVTGRRAAWIIGGLAAMVSVAAVAYGLAGLTSRSPDASRGHTSPAGPAALSSPHPASAPGSEWIAQLASVPFSQGTARLHAALASAQSQVPRAQVLNSSRYASLNPGYWVIYYAGPFANGAQALTYCADAGRTIRDQCIGRYLSHDPADFRYQCYPPAASPQANCYRPASAAPAAVVRAYLAAINHHDWPQVWQLGGKNLGTSYTQMIAGYQKTTRIVVTTITTSGDNVSARVLAYETTGAVQTYALSYTVSNGVIVAGQSTLLGTH